MSNDIQYYETVDNLDEANQLVDELIDQYSEDEGWSHDYSFDIRHDCVHVQFEAWRGE